MATKDPSQAKLEKVSKLVDSFTEKILATLDADEMYNMLKPEVEKRFREEFGAVPKFIKIQSPDEPDHTVFGTTHEMFETVLQLAKLRMPVYLEGPAGTGKLN